MTEQPADLTHDSFRELISARLDEALEMGADWELSMHLLGCARCWQFDHDLAEQRHLLRSLPEVVPPRDLWARTSSALDRELLREARLDPMPRPSPRRSSAAGRGRLSALATPGTLPSVLMVSMASLTLAVVLLITQLGPSLRLPASDIVGLPTPFGEPGVAVAFVGSDASGLTLYRTGVDQDESVAARLTFPARFEPDSLALAPRGDRLAIMGRDGERENVFAIMVVPPLVPLSPEELAPNPGRTRQPPSVTIRPAVATSTLDPSFILAGGTPVIPAEVAVSTILDGVHGVGAAPAWSTDGQALAFSAMPSDGHQGPDIYVWRVGDARARPITTDHGSYFASWSGSAIVVSRARRAEGNALSAAAPIIQTVSINPATAEERFIDGPEVWLPHIDPINRRAVAWRGRLAFDGAQVVPTHGMLYLLDWAAVDPFATSRPQATPDGADIDRTRRLGQASADQAPTTGAPTETPAATADAPTLHTIEPRGPGAAIWTEAPTPPPLDRRLVAIEPERDWLQHPVTDWRVVWSPDGRLFGQWIGDDTASVWGNLTVMSVDLQGRLDRQNLILDSTLARRGFNLGRNRVAWVAPLVGTPSGELRVRLWHGNVVRDVHIKPVESTGVVAAF